MRLDHVKHYVIISSIDCNFSTPIIYVFIIHWNDTYIIVIAKLCILNPASKCND